MPIIIEYKDEAEWLKLRESDVTSSDVACLFDESPYATSFEYWHRKRNGLVVEFDNNDRVKWGKRLEAPIANGLAEDHNWKIEPLKQYYRHDTCPRFGASFDFSIEENGGKGLLEIKNVDYKEYKAKWVSDGEEEAPVHIELQAQAQMEVADRDFCYIAALIAGNQPVVIRRDRDREIGKLMIRKVTDFWHRVDNDIEPLPDFERDGDIIKLLYAGTDGGEIDLSTNNRIVSLVAEYPELQKAATDAKKAQDAAKTEIAAAMKDAALGRVGDALITRKTVQRAGYSVEPCSYVDMRIKQPKAKS